MINISNIQSLQYKSKRMKNIMCISRKINNRRVSSKILKKAVLIKIRYQGHLLGWANLFQILILLKQMLSFMMI